MANGSSGEHWYNLVILSLAVVGAVVNVCSLVVLVRKRKCSMFYNLLKLLAASDIVVVVGGAMLYGLPDYWNYYSLRIYPFILPYTLPIVQIAMMISIYTTILMSFERYVRIGHTCRLKDCSYITEENFKYYMLAIMVGPCLFYVPKFFELRSVQSRLPIDLSVDCEAVLNPPKINYSAFRELFGATPAEFLMKHLSEASDDYDSPQPLDSTRAWTFPTPPVTTEESPEVPFLAECQIRNFSSLDHSKMINITQFVETVEIESTELRRNPLYYRIYCIALNTLASSAFPLLSLLYLNIYTVLALRAIGKENGAAISSRLSNAPKSPRSNSVRSTCHLRTAMASSTRSKALNKKIMSRREDQKENHAAQMHGFKRWKKTCSIFSICRKQKFVRRRNSREIRMRFVRETHSIEVVMPTVTENKPSYWKKPPITWLKICNGTGTPMSPEKPSTQSVQTRVRSESQCEYSPQKRNTAQMLQKRGKVNSRNGVQLYSNKHGKTKGEMWLRKASSAPSLFCSIAEKSNSDSSRLIVLDGNLIRITTQRVPEARSPLMAQSTKPSKSGETATVRISILRSGEARLTRIALAIVWLFIFCHVWRLIPTVFEALYPGNTSWPVWLLHVHGISHSLIVFNSAVNFLLYTVL